MKDSEIKEDAESGRPAVPETRHATSSGSVLTVI